MARRADIGQRLTAQCCFCGLTIADEGPRRIHLPLEDGGSQELYCHRACLRAALHASVPLGD
jgi:hypothetical protein